MVRRGGAGLSGGAGAFEAPSAASVIDAEPVGAEPADVEPADVEPAGAEPVDGGAGSAVAGVARPGCGGGVSRVAAASDQPR